MFEYIAHLRIVRAVELEENVRLIMNAAIGQNFGDASEKEVGNIQKEISQLLEYEREIESENEDYDWNKLR